MRLGRHDQRRRGHGIAALEILDLLLPGELAGLGVERDELGVERAEIDEIAVERGAAVDDVAAGQDALGQTGVIFPLLVAGLGVDGVEPAIGAGDVDHAVMDQRLTLLPALLLAAERERPGGRQTFDVRLVDLLQRAEALRLQTQAIGDDRFRVGRIVQQHFVGDGFGASASAETRPSFNPNFMSSSLSGAFLAPFDPSRLDAPRAVSRAPDHPPRKFQFDQRAASGLRQSTP